MSGYIYAPFNAATDGTASSNPFCLATDGFLCPTGRPRGGGKKRYPTSDVDFEKLKERVRVLRDRRDMRDLTALVRILAKMPR